MSDHDAMWRLGLDGCGPSVKPHANESGRQKEKFSHQCVTMGRSGSITRHRRDRPPRFRRPFERKKHADHANLFGPSTSPQRSKRLRGAFRPRSPSPSLSVLRWAWRSRRPRRPTAGDRRFRMKRANMRKRPDLPYELRDHTGFGRRWAWSQDAAPHSAAVGEPECANPAPITKRRGVTP